MASERPPPGLVLASEALKEDLAPIEPGARSARVVLCGISASLALLGLATREGLGAVGVSETASSVSLAAAGATAAIAALPFSYAVRATATTALGATLLLAGTRGAGPVGSMATSGAAWIEVARLVALATLPPALLFRARYRAYPVARVVLGVALLAAVPFLVGRALSLGAETSDLVDHAAALVDMAVVLAGLFGFMGENTTAGGSVWASLVLLVLPAGIALRALAPGASGGWAAQASAAVGAACGGTLVTIGAFHLLAAILGRDARRQAKKRTAEASPA